jgi:formate hydrogenlyase subunit 3/multisubunit Na+/H+ antiporter MnhD subunit
LGLVAAIRVLVTGETEAMSGIWHMPGGSLHLEIDALSVFFLLPVFSLSILTALYGRSYLEMQSRGALPSDKSNRHGAPPLSDRRGQPERTGSTP